MKKYNIVSGFCGVGKSYVCRIRDDFIELECWKYNGSNFPQNYLDEVESAKEQFDRVFISTDNRILRHLSEPFLVVYPRVDLKDEYLDRFKERRSSKDFIETLKKQWSTWIRELKSFGRGTHIILNSG